MKILALLAVTMISTMISPASSLTCDGTLYITRIGPNVRGLALIKDKKKYRAMTADCYVATKLFSLTTLEFELAYYAALDDDGSSLTDFAVVQVFRIVKDSETDSKIKIARKRPWYMVDGDRMIELKPVVDHEVPTTLEGWNTLHATPSGAFPVDSVKTANAELDAEWHGFPVQEDRKKSSWDHHDRLIMNPPALGSGERFIVSNLLLRYADVKSGDDVSLAPFDARIYDGTQRVIIRYYFGNDPTVRTVTICKSAC